MTNSMPNRPELMHISLLITNYIKNEKITMREMIRRLEQKPKWTGIYAWVRGRSAPTVDYRAKLAKVLGVEESTLLPKGGLSQAFKRRDKQALLKARALAPVDTLEQQLMEVQPPAAMRSLATVHPKSQDILTYAVDSEGQATVRLAVRGPHTRMAALFKLLLDAGLVPGGEEEQPG